MVNRKFNPWIVVLFLDVSVSIRIKRTMMCRFLHTLFCACFHRGGNEMNDITKLTQLYQRAEEELVSVENCIVLVEA